MGPSILRLSRFRPLQPSYDVALRTTHIPDLLARRGLLAIFAGRAGEVKDGPRLIASIWASRAAMEAALGADTSRPTVRPDYLADIADLEIEAHPIAFAFPPVRPADVGIARLVRGKAYPGQLTEYLEEARHGTEADRLAGVGPQALYLAVESPDRFVTLSLWDSWSHLEAATGADYADTSRTRHAELLEAWSVDHFEVVPGTMTVVDDIPAPQPA